MRAGLSTLPAPRNDYEIVVPEDEADLEGSQVPGPSSVEDQADVDQRALQTYLANSMY